MKFLHSNNFPWIDYDVIGFDMDGTLYNEINYIEEVYANIAQQIAQYTDFVVEDIYNWMLERWIEKGSSYPYIFSETLSEFSIQNRFFSVENCLTIYRNHEPNLSLESQVVKVLQTIQEEKPLFLVTDGHYGLQKRKFASLKLSDWFLDENVVFTGKFGASYYKPNTKVIDYIECLKNDDTSVLFLGDRKIDEEFAANANFSFIRVSRFEDFWRR